MAIKVVELHHTGVRIDAKDQSMAALQDFYTGVLGLAHDQGRPTIPGIPGMWINVGEVGQIHLIGGDQCRRRWRAALARTRRGRTWRWPSPTSSRPRPSSTGWAFSTGRSRG